MSKTLIDITGINQIIHSEGETVGDNVSIVVLSLKKGIEKLFTIIYNRIMIKGEI